jgi:hypothetical protein
VKRESWWPIGLVAVLGVTVLANVGVLFIAARNGGAEVAPDYYRRAIAWDSTMAAAARSRALRWTLDASLSPRSAGGILAVALRDSTGAPITGALVRIEGFAVARADRRFAGRLTETNGGHYALRLPLRGAEWQALDVTVRRGADRFVLQLRCLPGSTCRAP